MIEIIIRYMPYHLVSKEIQSGWTNVSKLKKRDFCTKEKSVPFSPFLI